MSDMKMYNILGKFNNVDPKMTPVKEDVKAEPVYENVEPRGSIMEAVKNLEEKYMGFKKTVAAIAKGGSAENPEAVAASIGRKKYGKKKFQKAAAAGKKLGEAAKPDFLDVDKDGNKKETFKKAVKDKEAKQVEEGAGPYELYNPKHPKFAANYKKFKAKNPDAKLQDFIDAMKKKEHGVNEGVVDSVVNRAKEKYHDVQAKRNASKHAEIADWDKEQSQQYLDKAIQHRTKRQELTKQRTGSTYNGLEEGEYDPAPVDPEAVAKRKRLQALKDKAEDEKEFGAEKNTPIRKIAGKAYGGSAQHDAPEADDLDEVAPPGAKAERMVKHIKKGYAKDGKLTKKEKGIAYATAWKAKKAGKLEESRVMEETDYFYEKVAKALADKNPALNTADSSFVTAVRQEMVAQGIDPNRARRIIMIDDDFIGDVATSYGHYVQEIAECDAPLNTHLGGGMEELDEIAALAGLSPKASTVCEKCGCKHSELDECAPLAAAAGADLAAAAPAIATVAAAKNNMEEEELDEREHFQSMPQGYASSTPKAPAVDPTKKSTFDKSKLNPMREEEMEEGNEFSGALAKAKASGAKEFEVDGKKYTVKEDINVNISANGEQDALNLIRRLSGLDEQEPMVQDPVQGEIPLSSIPTLEPQSLEDALAQGIIEPADEVDEERDIEHTNTPREEYAGIDAAIPAGADLNRAKKQYKKEYPGDNPMAVKEEALWKSYEAMIKDVKK